MATARARSLTLIVALVALIALAPAADALNVAARTIKARPSDAYSPHTAWDLGYHGCNVTIAVFDNGVDDRHPYLEGKVVAGYDATVTKAMWTRANGGNPQPVVGTHGTPVAGLAASHAGKPFYTPEDKPDYGEDDLVGVAPCAWLVDVMFSDVANDDGFEGDVLEAYAWAIAHKDDDWGDDDPSNDGIDIITMSWSPNDQTDGTDPICEAANEAVAAGIVVLGSAGNSGSVEEPDLGCPTGADGAISVANIWNERTVTRDDDELTDSSTWGPRTDDGDGDPWEELKPTVAAPGVGVIGTGASILDGREYGYACFGREVPVNTPVSCQYHFGGTSAATPMTAGTVALMLEANPGLTPAEVKEILHQTAERHGEMDRSAANLSAKWDHRYGYGMLDAYKAVRMAELWPGMDVGRDTDADGLRDVVDAAPRDPAVSELVERVEDLVPAAGVDTDGDLVPDEADPSPLDPRVAAAEDVALNRDAGASGVAQAVPGPGALALLLALGLAARRFAAPGRR